MHKLEEYLFITNKLHFCVWKIDDIIHIEFNDMDENCLFVLMNYLVNTAGLFIIYYTHLR